MVELIIIALLMCNLLLLLARKLEAPPKGQGGGGGEAGQGTLQSGLRERGGPTFLSVCGRPLLDIQHIVAVKWLLPGDIFSSAGLPSCLSFPLSSPCGA